MDILIKVGETGSTQCYSGVPKEEKVLFIQEKIKCDLKIEIKDQLLIAKGGYKLKTDDPLEILENEKAFSSTLQAAELNLQKSYYIVYVFNEQTLTQLLEQKSPKNNVEVEFLNDAFIQDNQEELKLIESKILETDYTQNFEISIGAESKNIEIIDRYSKDILPIERSIFTNYQLIKKKYSHFFLKAKKLEKTIQELDNQTQSADVLMMMAITCYQVTKSKKNELFKKIKEMQEKNALTVKKFDESLENLKKIELHDKLKSDKQKVLLDIYYNLDQMLQWRKTCITDQDGVVQRCDKVVPLLKSVKEKIKEERDSSIQNCRTNTKKVYSQFEHPLQDGKALILSLLTSIFEDYRNLRKNMQAYCENQDNESAQLYFSKHIPILMEKIKGYEDDIVKVANANIEQINEFYDALLKQRVVNEQTIAKIYKTLYKHVYECTIMTNEKMKKLMEELEKVEKNFSYLLNPSLLPTAYNASLSEISRRREFQIVFENEYKNLGALIDREKEKRLAFIQNYGRILPCDFIPALKNMTPIIKVQNRPEEKELPEIDGFNKDAVEKVNYQKDLERINQELNKEIRKFKEDAEYQNFRKREESLLKQLEELKQGNHLFKQRISEMEQQLSLGAEGNVIANQAPLQQYQLQLEERDQKIGKLTKEIDDLNACIQNMNMLFSKENQENIILHPIILQHDGSNGQNSEIACTTACTNNQIYNQKVIEKLNRRIINLTEILQQTTKASFNIFMRKTSDKQKKYNELKKSYDLCVNNFESDKKKLEEKLNQALQKANECDGKVSAINAENKKLNCLKDGLKDQIKTLKEEKESIQKDIKAKLELIKSKDDIIKSLNDIKNTQSTEIQDIKQKLVEQERKIKVEHTEMLGNIHAAHKQEQERLKARMKQLEVDITNKQTELDKLQHTISELKKEAAHFREEAEKVQKLFETAQKQIDKAKTDHAEQANKVENMELTQQKRQAELTSLQKQCAQLQTDKAQAIEEVQKSKTIVQELQKKLQRVCESVKACETERESMLSQLEKLRLEAEKKSAENAILNRQIQQIMDEKKAKKEQLDDKLAEHRERVSQLQQDLNDRTTELSMARTKAEIMQADVENKQKELVMLREQLETLENENSQLDEQLTKLNDKLQQTLQEKENELKDIKIINEQLQIESEIKERRIQEVENNLSEVVEKHQKDSTVWKSKEQQIELELSEAVAQTELMQKRLLEREQELAQAAEEERKLEQTERELAIISIRTELQTQADDEIKALQQEMESNKKIMKQLEKQEEYYREELRRQTEEGSSIKVKLEEQSQKLQTQLEEVLELRQQLEDSRRENTSLQDARRKMEENLEVLQKDFQEFKNSSISDNKKLQETQKNKLEKLQNRCDQETQKLRELQNQCVELQRLNDSTAESNRKLQTENQEYKAKFQVQKEQKAVQVDEDEKVEDFVKTMGNISIDAPQSREIMITQWEEVRFKRIIKSIAEAQDFRVAVKGRKDTFDLLAELRKTSILRESISFVKVEEGQKLIFIPASRSIYTPLILKQINEIPNLIKEDSSNSNNNLSNSYSFTSGSYKNNLFLDFDTMDPKYKDLLIECSLILIATVKNIIPKRAKKDRNPFNLKENEEYQIIQIENPEYIVGFEEEDMSLKNYAIF